MQSRTIATMFVMAMAVSAAIATEPVMSFPMEMNADKELTEIVSSKTYAVRGRHGENVPAVVGNGLRTDAYSTYVQVPMSDFSLNNKTLSISFWTACQTYPMMVMDIASNREGAIISCLDDTNKQGFAFYLYSQGKYGFSCYINGEKKNVAVPSVLPQYEWLHLCVTIDAENGSITFYKNGKEINSTYVKGTIDLPQGNLYIGKSSVDVRSGVFLLNTYNGIIDELNIYNSVLSEEEIVEQANVSAPLDLNMPASHYRNEISRPRHHAMPAAGWMNESHGMAYSDGRYHLFFQKNGNGPYMSRLHWGHLSSEDLCNWQEERIALVPGKNYDIKGCWSGCVFNDEEITKGEPWILYTGVDNGRATIDLATPADEQLLIWNKSSRNPVINGTPSGYSADFRDPYFFRNGSDAYCIVGTSINGVGATSLHKYNSSTGLFDYVGYPFFTGTNESQCGSFFEMSNITNMGDGKWLFTTTPLGSASGVRTIYYVGTIADNGTFSTSQPAPKTVELPGLAKYGYGLLSPTILQKDGKTIVIGIVPDILSSTLNYNVGWAHNFSFPREWSIDAQGDLVQKPFSGLTTLRSENMASVEPQTLNGEISLEPVSGLEIEVEAVFTVASQPFGVKILQNEEGNACKIYYSPTTQRFIVDFSSIGRRNNDTGRFDGVYSTTLPVTPKQGETLKIHVFFDHSILDLFINDRWASSIRIFPTSYNSKGVSVFAEGDTPLQSVNAWIMTPSGIDITDALPEIKSSNSNNYSGSFDLLGRPIGDSYNGLLYIKNGKLVFNR